MSPPPDPARPGWSSSWLVVCATFLFATMGVCVKLASAEYPPGELVFYRSLTGALLMLVVARWQGGTVATRVPAMHFWRSFSGVISLCLWFYAIGNLPLATAMTLNYMSSVWMALFLIGGAIVVGTARVDADQGDEGGGRAHTVFGESAISAMRGLRLRSSVADRPAPAIRSMPAIAIAVTLSSNRSTP